MSTLARGRWPLVGCGSVWRFEVGADEAKASQAFQRRSAGMQLVGFGRLRPGQWSHRRQPGQASSAESSQAAVCIAMDPQCRPGPR